MLGIKIGNEFLDLMPDTKLELEQNNPNLQFGDEIEGEFSYTFDVAITPKNLRLLNYAGLVQARVDVRGVDGSVYHNGIQHSIGKVKVEKPSINLNNSAAGTISCYYVTGISSFYQDVKDKRLRDIDTGGDRTFTGDNFDETGSGFWGHVQTVMHGAAGYGASGFDYAFYPVNNADFGETTSGDILNNLNYTAPTTFKPALNALSNLWPNLIVPFPYLKYVLIKAIEYCGWNIDGDILNDPDFMKITMINSLCINYGYKGWNGVLNYHEYPVIKFNVSNHLPDMTIPEFLLALKNRFGWVYEFDRKNKTIHVKPLVSTIGSAIKDFSKYANPLVVKTVSNEKKVYSIKVAGDDSSIDLTGLDYKGTIDRFINLPTPDASKSAWVYLAIDENNYYICEPDGSDWVWSLLTANNRSVVPTGTTDDINTNCQIPFASVYKGNNLSSNYMMIPQWNEQGCWPGHSGDVADYSGSLVLAFYYGLKLSAGGVLYPFASPNIYDSEGNQVGNWSLALKATKTNGAEVGLYDLNWKKFLETLSSREQLEVVLNLPLVDYLELNFGDIIVIKNVKMYIQTLKPVIPYKNSITVDALRI